MVTRSLHTDKAREFIKNENYGMAILTISADLETHFFEKLFIEKGINPDLMNNWTLSRLTDWNYKHNYIRKISYKKVKKFNQLRNLFAHQRYFISTFEGIPERVKKVKKLLLWACKFIDKSILNYPYDSKIEEKYGKELKKRRDKVERWFLEK